MEKREREDEAKKAQNIEIDGNRQPYKRDLDRLYYYALPQMGKILITRGVATGIRMYQKLPHSNG